MESDRGGHFRIAVTLAILRKRSILDRLSVLVDRQDKVRFVEFSFFFSRAGRRVGRHLLRKGALESGATNALIGVVAATTTTPRDAADNKHLGPFSSDGQLAALS